jgi:hypothetical protein
MFDPRVALAVILTLFVSVLQAGTAPHAAAPVIMPQAQGIYPPQRLAVRPVRHPRHSHAAKRPLPSKKNAAKQHAAAAARHIS